LFKGVWVYGFGVGDGGLGCRHADRDCVARPPELRFGVQGSEVEREKEREKERESVWEGRGGSERERERLWGLGVGFEGFTGLGWGVGD